MCRFSLIHLSGRLYICLQKSFSKVIERAHQSIDFLVSRSMYTTYYSLSRISLLSTGRERDALFSKEMCIHKRAAAAAVCASAIPLCASWSKSRRVTNARNKHTCCCSGPIQIALALCGSLHALLLQTPGKHAYHACLLTQVESRVTLFTLPPSDCESGAKCGPAKNERHVEIWIKSHITFLHQLVVQINTRRGFSLLMAKWKIALGVMRNASNQNVNYIAVCVRSFFRENRTRSVGHEVVYSANNVSKCASQYGRVKRDMTLHVKLLIFYAMRTFANMVFKWV
jgi:hypothetical protein